MQARVLILSFCIFFLQVSPCWLCSSSELSSSRSTVWADFLLLRDADWRHFADCADDTDRNGAGLEEGSREKPSASGGEDDKPGSETEPSWLWLLLKVQLLPFILLRLPMELRMMVARLMDSLDRSKFEAVLRSRLVLMRLWRSEENVPTLETIWRCFKKKKEKRKLLTLVKIKNKANLWNCDCVKV